MVRGVKRTGLDELYRSGLRDNAVLEIFDRELEDDWALPRSSRLHVDVEETCELARQAIKGYNRRLNERPVKPWSFKKTWWELLTEFFLGT